MLLTDTNSLIYKIETENVFEDFYKVTELFDLKISKYYDDSNNSVVDKIKDETWGVALISFLVLKSKMHNFKTGGNHESKKAKGINKNVVDDELKFEDYKSYLLNISYMRHEINRIESKDH